MLQSAKVLANTGEPTKAVQPQKAHKTHKKPSSTLV
jgi:hypothetical protein